MLMSALFRRDIPPSCAYCEYAARGGGEIICTRRGRAAARDACKAFRYDPLRRIPPRPASLRTNKFKASDFAL